MIILKLDIHVYVYEFIYIHIYVIYTYLHKDNSKFINNEVAGYNYDKIRKIGKEKEKTNQERVV